MTAHRGRFAPGVPVGFLGLAVATELGAIAYGFLPEAPAPRAAWFIALQLALAAPSLAALVLRRFSSPSLAWVLGAATVVRLTCLPSDLIFENDVFRYLWDARVTASGLNPYRDAPAAPELAHLVDAWVFPQIPYRHVPTVYPPLAQLLFVATRAIFGESVVALQGVMIAFDLGTVVALDRLGRSLGAPRAAAAYALHPLAIKEFAQAAHVDAAAVCLVAWAAVALVRGRVRACAVVLAIGSLIKVFPIVLAPVLARRAGLRPAAILVAVAAVPWVALALAGVNPFVGLAAFTRYWIFNPSVYDLVVRALELGLVPQTAHTVARPIAAALTVAAIAAIAWRMRAADDASVLRAWVASVFALLLFSPAANPWYVAWLVPLALAVDARAAVAWSYTASLAYAFYLDGRDIPWLRAAQYLPVGALLVASAIRGRLAAAGGSVAPTTGA